MGMNRERITSLANRLRRESAAASPGTWATQRGGSRVSGQFDVIGNFPGYGRWAALIVAAKVEVTSRFLLVDEHADHGFGIDLADLVDYSIDRSEQSFGDVIIRFRISDLASMFRLRPSRNRLRFPTRTNPTDLAQALADGGVIASEFTQDLESTLGITWENAQTMEVEPTVWSGKATAPLRPGRECEPGSIWLTKTALLWGSARGSGLNRVPAAAITVLNRLQLPDGRETPVAYVHTDLMHGLDLALPIIFNTETGAQNRLDRDAFIGLFHPDLVKPLEDSVLQPWTVVDEILEEGDAADLDELSLADAEDLEDDESAEPEATAEPAFSSWDGARRPYTFEGTTPGTTLRRIDTSGLDSENAEPAKVRLYEAMAAWPGAETADPAPEPEATPANEPTVVVAYLAKARQTIDEVNDRITRRLEGNAAIATKSLPPSAVEQANALIELIELAGTGYYSPDQVSRIKAQISGLGEAAVRLRSLIELCNAGHLTIAEAAAKRDRIMGGIAMLLASE